MRLKKKQISLPFVLVWLLFGMLLSMIAIQFRLSGSMDIKKFYNVGKKYIVRYSEYTMSYDGCEYRSDGLYHITKDDCQIPVYIKSAKNRHWNFMYVDLRHLSTDTLTWEITSYDKNGKEKGQTIAVLKEGMNEIQLGPKKSSQVNIRILNQKGVSFQINAMQFRKNRSYYGTVKVLLMLLFCMAVYSVVTGILYHFWLRRIPWQRMYDLVNLPVKGYEACSVFLKGIAGKCSETDAIRVRRSCFFIIILGMILTENYGFYSRKYYYYSFLLINCILLFIIALVSYGKKRKRVFWKNPLMLSWLIYIIFACVSDILVPGKVQMWTGAVMLVVFGFLFFVMAGMKSPITVLYDFMQAVKYSYYIFAVISLLCRPIGRMAEGRYIGAVVSPYSFAMYLVVVIVVFLAEIDKEITENTAKTHLLLNGIGFISAVYFLWLTGSRNGELAAALCIFFYFMRIWILKTNVSYRKKIVRVACVMGILAVPSLWLQNWAVHNLAEKLGTVMYYPNDDRMLEYPGEQADSILQGLRIEIFPADIVYAAETADTGAQREMMKKSSSIELLSSGRTTIYKEYIANMNLFGHKKELRIWGEKMRAHNAVLQTGYRYGVFSMIPYVIMLLYVLIYSWRYMKQNWNKAGSYAVFPFLLAVSSEVMMMLDNVERNFRYVPWIAFYLLIGLLGQRKNP